MHKKWGLYWVWLTLSTVGFAQEDISEPHVSTATARNNEQQERAPSMSSKQSDDGDKGDIVSVVEQAIAQALTKPDDERAATKGNKPSDATGMVERQHQRVLLTGVSARVRESGGQELLSGVTIEIAPAEAHVMDVQHILYTVTSDVNGYAFVGRLAKGEYAIRASSSTHQTRTWFFSVEKPENITADIYLAPRGREKFQTVVQGKKNEMDASRVMLTRQEIEAIPGTLGDPIRVLESLPGVARTPFLSGSVMIRGGLPGDTQVYFDGIPIPLLYHFGGFASVITRHVVDRIDFYQGGMPSIFGNSTAGTVNIIPRVPEEHIKGEYSFDLFDTDFYLGGPISQKNWGWNVNFAGSARRSYIDLPISFGLQVAELFNVRNISFPVPAYSDYFARVRAYKNKKHQFGLTVLGAEDAFDVVGEVPQSDRVGLNEDGEVSTLSLQDFLNQGLGSRFARVVLEHEYRPKQGIHLRTRPWVGTTRRGLLGDGLIVGAFTGSPLIPPTENLSWGSRIDYALNDEQLGTLRAGLEYIGENYQLSTRFLVDQFDQQGVDFADPCPVEDLNAGTCPPGSFFPFDIRGRRHQLGFYTDWTAEVTDALQVRPGLRLNIATDTFEDILGLIPYDVVGGTTMSEQVRQRLRVDPRLSVRYKVSSTHALKFSGGAFSQQPQLNDVVMQTGGPLLNAPRATHWILGFDGSLNTNITYDVQTYLVNRQGLTVETNQRAGNDILENFGSILQPGVRSSIGSGDTMGFETMLRWLPTSSFFGWVSYTFARSTMNLLRERDFAMPAPFDSRHNLVVLGKWNLPKKWTAGFRFQLATGAPSPVRQNLTVYQDIVQGRYDSIASPLRRPRQPTYHRLDLRFDRTVYKRHYFVRYYLEIVNAYNAFNSEVVGPGPDFRGRSVATLIPGLPIFPSFGISGGF